MKKINHQPKPKKPIRIPLPFFEHHLGYKLIEILD